ncbi:MAG TPA: Zn-ribbon domain-containing OB-fold protein [Acidimicrobiales bacterium]|nr:Zn-ribbon domain-containing OB-fold protein [Acidimicrobiales bacterium]
MTTTAEAGGLPAPEPYPNTEDAPFWAGTAEGRLVLPKCTNCGTVIWYPRQFCSECSGRDVEWFQASGRGTIYARTVVHRAQGPWRDAAPYVIAYVELEEGPRVLTNIIGVDPAAVEVGQEVHAVFIPAGAHRIVRFTR